MAVMDGSPFVALKTSAELVEKSLAKNQPENKKTADQLRIEELEKENKKLKQKLKNATEHNKLFMKLTP